MEIYTSILLYIKTPSRLSFSLCFAHELLMIFYKIDDKKAISEFVYEASSTFRSDYYDKRDKAHIIRPEF